MKNRKIIKNVIKIKKYIKKYIVTKQTKCKIDLEAINIAKEKRQI